MVTFCIESWGELQMSRGQQQLLFVWCEASMAASADPKIVVIGCGISGISAAHRLVKAGFHHVRILEATARSGGRIKTSRLGERVHAQWQLQFVLQSVSQKQTCHVLPSLLFSQTDTEVSAGAVSDSTPLWWRWRAQPDRIWCPSVTTTLILFFHQTKRRYWHFCNCLGLQCFLYTVNCDVLFPSDVSEPSKLLNRLQKVSSGIRNKHFLQF